jgi:metal-responsive CopG/Arc/MetJ family transcriptional regulator
MGRPPLNVKNTTVRLPLAVLERIDRLLGRNRRAQFIRQAVEEKLARDDQSGEPSAS